jgi:hypothetical protein
MVDYRNFGEGHEDWESVLGDYAPRWSPEQHLIWAVLDRAIRDACLIAGPGGLECGLNRKKKRGTPATTYYPDYVAAIEWIRSSDKRPWGFLWCIEKLRLNKGHVEFIFEITPSEPAPEGHAMPWTEWHQRMKFRSGRDRKQG